MTRPRPPAGGSDDSGVPTRPDDDGNGGSHQRPGTSVKAAENVSAAQETTAREAEQGRPGRSSGDGAPGDRGGDSHRTPPPGTPEYDRRVDELAADPAHNGRVSAKSRREAEVGLAVEAQGLVPGPISRAPIDNSDPAFQRDLGEFIDADGNYWDVKSPADVFPAGRNAGQPMPPGMRGRYDGDDFEQKLADELAGGQRVIIDTKNLSPSAAADLRSRVAGRPDWDGRVVFDK